MKIIAGLGNPGDKYKNTRHNAGFLAIDYLLGFDEFMAARPSKDFKSELFTLELSGQKIVLMKPQTYMNDSGRALCVFCNFYKIDLSKDLLVLHDDADLPLGAIRLTTSSSSAGQNGVQSIINELGTQDFNRIRIGIETRSSRLEIPTDTFVLQDFTEAEQKLFSAEVLPKVKEEIEKFIKK